MPIVTQSSILSGAGAGTIPLSALASQADQTLVGNVSGGAASPIALTRTQSLGLLSGGAATSDVAPTVGLLNSQHAYAQATGANRTGAALALAGGIGSRFWTSVDWSTIDIGDTITLTLTSRSTGAIVTTATVITAFTGWTPVTSNALTAAALATYVNTLGLSLTALAVGDSCYFTPTSDLIAFTLATSMAAGEGTVTSGTDGQTFIGGAGSTTVPMLALNSATTGFGNPSGSAIDIILSSTHEFRINAAGLELQNVNYVGWWSGTTASATDLEITRLGAANLRQGKSPSASPVAQTFTIGEASRPGTDSNVGGASGTIQPGLGTGTGTASSLTLQGVVLAGAGSGVQSYQDMIKITGVSLGFYNHAVTALQTGVAVSAAGIHAALVNLGLITA